MSILCTARPASIQARRDWCRPRPAESSDDYTDVVAILNDRWRVMASREGIQWILQYRNRAETVAGDVWRGRGYCHTGEALIRACDAHAGSVDPESRTILVGLPEWFPEANKVFGDTTRGLAGLTGAATVLV
jgi:hypothetical protein